ncbi:26S protease regulatory subunit 6A [Lentinula raphanica]|uniref:26S protease regulatory subunit 6A n=1 Tax=Lentinula raphanica TaxID=153919 RepID=A0AA38UK01_9AGAR|nr:26S protease regulatory subunit 6A [Lentinula raphanica]KAJ3967493.1 26S protease regulatory subunit 6A [Lentinula raphanica]
MRLQHEQAVIEILGVDSEAEEDGANPDLDSTRKGKCDVVKASTRQTVYLPLIGLVPLEKLKPSDLAARVEAGIMVSREGVSNLTREHFLTGISEGQLINVVCYRPGYSYSLFSAMLMYFT